MTPRTKYARSGRVSIAYQVLGDGPIDLIQVPGSISHLEFMWTEPTLARTCEGFASFSRLIRFDKRGTGMSDRDFGIATMEERMDDVRAVLDAVGSETAAVYGVSEGGPLAALFAATHPDRTSALILYGTFPQSSKHRTGPASRRRRGINASKTRSPTSVRASTSSSGLRAWPTIPRAESGGPRWIGWAPVPAPCGRCTP